MRKIRFFFVLGILFLLYGCAEIHTHEYIDGMCNCGTAEDITYNISFRDVDGTLLKVLEINKDDVPEFDYKIADSDEFYYEFIGWSKEPNGEILDTLPSAIADVTYYANVHKIKKQYTVNLYNFYGELLSTISYDYGMCITEFEYEEIDRMIFNGWYYQDELVTFPLIVRNDIDLYPKYEKEIITVGSNGLFQSLQSAIDYALPYDIINVSEGIYDGAIINKPLEIRGINYNKISKDLNGTVFTSSIIINSSSVTINGVTLTQDAIFSFDNLENSVENISFLYCSFIDSTINKNNERNKAPFYLV